MKTLSSFALPAAVLSLSACVATVGHSSSVSVPKEAPQTCAASCSEMGLVLSSVVIMANNVGCVCAAKAQGPAADNGAAASAGLVTVLMRQAEEQEAQASAASSH